MSVAVVAVLRCLREVLISMPLSLVRLRAVLSQEHVIPIPRLLEEFYSLRDRSSALAPVSSDTAAERLLFPGGSYPALPRKPHPVLDYFVQDRHRARAEIEDARSAVDDAERKYRAIEALTTEESSIRDVRAEWLEQEASRRSLAAKEDTLLEAKQKQHAGKLLAARLDRLDLASASAAASMAQHCELHEAERARVASEVLRRRRRAAAEDEAWQREMELVSTEAWTTQQLAEIARHHRVDDADRELRQFVRAELLSREREDEATRHEQQLEDERARARLRAQAERELEVHQWELADMRRREIEVQLALDDHVRLLQLGEISRERSVRAAARDARIESEAQLSGLRQQLAEEAHGQAQAQDAALARERHRQERRLQRQSRDATEQRAQTHRILDAQSAQLHAQELAEERSEFELRLQRAVAANETAMREHDLTLQKELAVVEEVRHAAHRDEALDTQHREAIARRSVQRRRLRQAAAEHLGAERRRSAAVRAQVGQPWASSETGATNSEEETQEESHVAWRQGAPQRAESCPGGVRERWSDSHGSTSTSSPASGHSLGA